MVYKPKRSYEWNNNGFVPSLDANIVGGVCEHIEETEGGVTKHNFLEFSTPEDSPTHCLFEWDDGIAAHKYRLRQSTSIISCLRITYINKRKEEAKVNAFINVSRPEKTSVYESIESALSDDVKRSIVLARIQGELDAFVARNSTVEELADILERAAQKLRAKKGA